MVNLSEMKKVSPLIFRLTLKSAFLMIMAISPGLTQTPGFYTYLEITGSDTVKVTRKIEKENGLWKTKFTGPLGVFFASCSLNDRKAENWIMKNHEGEVIRKVEKNGGSVLMTGINESKTGLHNLENKPWLQLLDMALVHSSMQPGKEFWIIRPDEFEVVLLQIDERVEEGDKLRVRIRPAGLKKKLWHADYWFRKSDGQLVASQSKRSMLAPPTLTKLIDEKPL